MSKKALHVSYDVLLVISGLHVNAKTLEIFEKHLKKEGFLKIENEEFAYIGKASLSLMHTRAFIFDILKKAMQLSKIDQLSFICQLGNNPFESYIYDRSIKSFQKINK